MKKSYSISVQMLEFFLSKGTMACVPVYMELIHTYSSKFHTKNLKELCTILNKKEATVRKQLHILIELGMVKNHNNKWYFAIGKKEFNKSRGICHSKMVTIPDEYLSNTSNLRTFAYSVLYEQAARHIESNKFKHKKQQNQTKRGSLPIAGNFMRKFKKNHVDKTTVTWNKQRKKAAKLGLLDVKRNFEVVKSGGQEVKQLCVNTRPYLTDGYKHLWKEQGGVFTWKIELPAQVYINIPFKKQHHNYTREEKQIIKNNFQYRFGRD